MALTKHQKGVFDSIVKDIRRGINGNDDYSILSLIGSPGTGKTFVLSEIIKEFYGKYEMTLTAPTHKAVKVIRDTLSANSAPQIDCRTIHSFLKLKLEDDLDTGIPFLTPNLYSKDHIKNVDILFCDESSMVSNELLRYCAEKLRNGSIKVVVLIGDIFQLLPVDDQETADVIVETPEYELTEIVRQERDNPIIKTAMMIKECIRLQRYPRLNHFFDMLPVVDSRADLINRYIEDKSDIMVGTYTNDISQSYNMYLRKTLKNNPKDSIIPGDVLSFHDTHMVNKSLVHLNADLSTVVSCEKHRDGLHNVDYWTITDDDYMRYNVLDRSSVDEYEKKMKLYVDAATAADNKKERNANWGKYFSMKKRYANVRYNYSSTLHRLQGSTVDNIYLDLSDLTNNTTYDKDTIFRLMYVGLTRARNEAIILL